VPGGQTGRQIIESFVGLEYYVLTELSYYQLGNIRHFVSMSTAMHSIG